MLDHNTPTAKKCGFKYKGYLCFEEDSQENVALRELLDKYSWLLVSGQCKTESFKRVYHISLVKDTDR